MSLSYVDQPARRKRPGGIPHHDAADSEGRRKVCDARQPFAGCKLTAHNPSLDFIRDLVAQRLGA
jgi:hypothetical protein